VSRNTHWFLILADPRGKLEARSKEWNAAGPRSAIRSNLPIDLKIPGGAASPLL
jgi:hypothetical protein